MGQGTLTLASPLCGVTVSWDHPEDVGCAAATGQPGSDHTCSAPWWSAGLGWAWDPEVHAASPALGKALVAKRKENDVTQLPHVDWLC